MGVRRVSDVEDYLEDDEVVTRPRRSRVVEDEEDAPRARRSADAFEKEDEDEVPANAGIVQAGWAAAKKQMKEAAASGTSTEFKFSEDVQVVKFLSGEPLAFRQHWLDKKEGRKSYVCIGASCPLCRLLGDQPSQKYAFSIVNLSAEEMVPQLLVVGTRLCGTFEKLHNDPKTGPLEKNFWALSKTGSGPKTSYTVLPVKERDLADDWDLDPDDVADALADSKPLGPEAIRVSTKSELTEIAHELAE